MRIKINGKLWDLEFVNKSVLRDREGACDSPETPNKKIRVLSSLKGEDKLEILIHEMLHAGFWQIAEEEITQIAADIARILVKLGYTDEKGV